MARFTHPSLGELYTRSPEGVLTKRSIYLFLLARFRTSTTRPSTLEWRRLLSGRAERYSSLTGPALDNFPTTFDADTLTSYELATKLDDSVDLLFAISLGLSPRRKDIQLIGSMNCFELHEWGGCG